MIKLEIQGTVIALGDLQPGREDSEIGVKLQCANGLTYDIPMQRDVLPGVKLFTRAKIVVHLQGEKPK